MEGAKFGLVRSIAASPPGSAVRLRLTALMLPQSRTFDTRHSALGTPKLRVTYPTNPHPQAYRNARPAEVIELILASARLAISAGRGAYCRAAANCSPSWTPHHRKSTKALPLSAFF